MAPSVVRHADLHVARYHKPTEEEGRGWFTWDGEQVVSFDSIPYDRVVADLAEGLIDVGEDTWDAWRMSERAANANGLFHLDEFIETVEGYPSIPFDEALTSGNVIVRSLAMLDRRLGKRRLRQIRLSSHEFPSVRRLHELRCRVEGIAQSAA